MLSRTRKLIVIAAAALSWPCTTARGQSDFEFYKGPAVIRSVTGTIDLRRDKPADAKLQVEIQNTSGHPLRDLSVNFRGSEEKAGQLSIRRGKTTTVTPTPTMEYVSDPEGVRQVRLDLVLQINGLIPNKPIGDTDLLILLPPEVPALIRSNMPLVTAQPDRSGPGRESARRPKSVRGHEPAARSKRGQGYAEEGVLPEPGSVQGRAAYRLIQKNTYLTELNLIYNATSVTLKIKKSINPPVIAQNNVVTVTLQVCNWGPDPATNVQLTDTFDPRDFARYTGGQGTFQDYASENDRRLLWTHTIPGPVPLCASAASLPVVYNVMAKLPVSNCWLNAATATIGGKFVGVSNKIKLGP